MIDSTTRYIVETRYTLDDRSSAALDKIAAAADRAGESAHKLHLGLGHLAGGFGIHAIIHKAKEAFIDFNAEVEQSKIALSAVLESNLGGSFEKAQKKAEMLFGEFQKFAVTSPFTTKEVGEFATAVSNSLFSAGASVKQFTEISEKSMVAARVFHLPMELAAIQVQEMMAGTVRKGERFAQSILHLAHVSAEQWRAMTGQQRLAVFEKAVTSDAIKQAAVAQGNSFKGVLSTFEDKLQIALGKVGKPLFEAITKEIKGWNEWMEKNGAKLEEIGQKFGRALVDGFQVVKSAIGFVVEHREMFLKIAAMWMALKGINFAAAGGSALTSVFVNLAKGGASAAGSLVALYSAAQVLASYLDEQQSKAIEGASVTNRAEEYGTKYEQALLLMQNEDQRAYASRLLNMARDANSVTVDAEGHQVFNKDRYERYLKEKVEAPSSTDPKELAKYQERLAMLDVTVAQTADAFLRWGNQLQANSGPKDVLQDWMKKGFDAVRDAADEQERRNLKNGDVNVTIQHLEVAAPDADRFIIDLDDVVAKVRRNPSQARDTLRGWGG